MATVSHSFRDSEKIGSSCFQKPNKRGVAGATGDAVQGLSTAAIAGNGSHLTEHRQLILKLPKAHGAHSEYHRCRLYKISWIGYHSVINVLR